MATTLFIKNDLFYDTMNTNRSKKIIIDMFVPANAALIIETAYLYKKPRSNPFVASQITIGDLHANAIKFIYFLIREGLCNLIDSDYNKLIELYDEADKLCQIQNPNQSEIQNLTNCLDHFKKIIDKLRFTSKKTIIRLLGDILADRGSNDYFILLILNVLRQNNVTVRIMISNHDGEFVNAYESFFERGALQGKMICKDNGATKSLENLAYLLKHNIINFLTLQELVESSYKPNLYLLDSTLDTTNELTIFSHAPIGIGEIELLTNKMAVHCHDTLHLCIKKINQNFHNYMKNPKKRISTLYFNNDYFQPNSPTSPQTRSNAQKTNVATKENIIHYCMWNRNINDIHRPRVYHDYLLTFIHGHDSSESNEKHVHSLNNTLGFPNISSGEYTVFRFIPSAQKEKQHTSSFFISHLLNINLKNQGLYYALIALGVSAIYFSSKYNLPFFKSSENKDSFPLNRETSFIKK